MVSLFLPGLFVVLDVFQWVDSQDGLGRTEEFTTVWVMTIR